MKKSVILFIILAILFAACGKKETTQEPKMTVAPDTVEQQITSINLSREQLYNKILGSLVGSAIGDAMGASTEMWQRKNRRVEYGFIDSLTATAIAPSPEGVWDYNLPPGSTTDDTRWKLFTGAFMVQNINGFLSREGPSPYRFADYIVDAYQEEVNRLKNTSGFDPKNFEDNIRRMAWLQEWATVARPFAQKNLEEYTMALHKFYGGELLCAGILYAPTFGLTYPGHPKQAYKTAYRLGIFDQGYARDITGLTAAMVATAMKKNASPDSILAVFRTVDPHNYFRRRLFSRIAFQIYKEALYITDEAKGIKTFSPGDISLPIQSHDSLYVAQMEKAFTLLDEKQQDAPAHAREILLVSLTSMMFSDFDFQRSMEFITNYGRDNDTSGALAGAVLGAHAGFDQLPGNLKNKVLNTNKNKLNIDLRSLAEDLTKRLYNILG